jgi:hypothetical protein
MTFDPVVVAPNAQLLAIRPQRDGDGYGAPDAQETARWTGSIEARADDQRRRVHAGSGDVDRVTETELRFDGRLVADVDELEVGDEISYSVAGDTLTREVRQIHRADVGLVTLTFWDA